MNMIVIESLPQAWELIPVRRRVGTTNLSPANDPTKPTIGTPEIK